MGVGYELLVAFVIIGLLMLLFPVILIEPVYKCSSLFTLGVIWRIEFLIQNGAQVSSVSSFGYPPLHNATGYGNIDAIKILLKYGTDFNHLNYDGYDALYMIRGHEEWIRLLITTRAIVNRTYPNGKTILSYVDKMEKPELWQYFYDRGARVAPGKSSAGCPLAPRQSCLLAPK